MRCLGFLCENSALFIYAEVYGYQKCMVITCESNGIGSVWLSHVKVTAFEVYGYHMWK